MKLDTLLKQITRLPWQRYDGSVDGLLKAIPKIVIGEIDGYHIGYVIGDVPSLPMKENAAYLVHAANCLPELVEAVKKLTSSAEGYSTVGVLVSPQLLNSLRDALARAEEVKE